MKTFSELIVPVAIFVVILFGVSRWMKFRGAITSSPHPRTCVTNLNQISRELVVYSLDSEDGKSLPITLDELVGPELSSHCLYCEETKHAKFKYVGAGQKRHGSRVLLYCLPENHANGKAFVAFGGGNIKQLDKAEFEKLLKSQGIKHRSRNDSL